MGTAIKWGGGGGQRTVAGCSYGSDAAAELVRARPPPRPFFFPPSLPSRREGGEGSRED